MAQSPVNGANAVPVPPRNAQSPPPAPPQASALQRESPTVDGSRPATPSQTMGATSQPPADDATRQPPAPYWYEYVTDPIVGSWDESGKQSILETAKAIDVLTVSTILQELVRSGLDGRLNATDAGSVIRDLIAHHSESEIDVQSLFLNTISLLEESDTKSSSLLTIVAATDIDPDVIRQELNIPLLQALPLVRSTFSRMRDRKTTNILYRQANFNLLREETEGYAKLITEYFNTANEATHDHRVSAGKAFERITALVGSFDLDVGRVLDITLDISANLLVRAYGFFIKFYRCSSWWPDSGVLDNVKWEDQGFNSFPKWALPGTDADTATGEEKAVQKTKEADELAMMKGERDIRFWERAKEVGIGAFFELGTRTILDFEAVLPLLQTEVPPEYDRKGDEVNPDRRKRINENRKYMAETGTLPPPGNPDAAQLLGFKLRFYASSARDAQDTLPENLIYLAALLIKIGFISLRDLYPHLYPADDKMPEEKTRLEKEKAEKEAKERPGVGSNALAMAGALPDDTLPLAATRALRGDKEKSGASTPKPEKKEEEPKDELPSPVNQKIMLLKALLLIGALPEALYILGRFPWLVDVDHTLPPYLHRIANQMLGKVADIVRPLNRPDDTQVPKDELDSVVPRSDGTLTFKPREQKKVTRWLGLDQVEKGDGLTYRHYYPEWDDNIPLCEDVEDVFLLCNTFLGYLGVKIGQDAKLLSTLVRIAKHSLTEDFSEPNQTRWLELMRRLLVPALSLSKHNAGLTQEVYELLKFFPTTTRYYIYAEWFRGKTSRLPDMRVAFEHNKAEVKDVLRRVTNETGKKQARALAKISFSSPGIVMMLMINQLESYSNMIPSLVECTRYFPLLAYDVLTWSLINSLSGQGRDRMQADGMLTSPWLQALSQFVASLFYRYTVLNPSPVLQYLASELRAGNSTDLEMFEQLLAEMAGIRPDMEFNDAQVLAMAGGKHLQAQTVMQLADKRHDRKPQAQRLIKALSDPGLIGQTLIAIAQERQNYPYHDSSKYMPLKVLGNNLDKVQQVFAQYLDVLKTNLSPIEFEAAVPDVVSLVGEFGLEPGIAFTICRFCIAQRVLEYDSAKKQENDDRKRALSQERPQTNGDVEMHESKPVTDGDHPTPEATQDSTAVPQDGIVREESKTALTPQPVTSDDEVQPWHPILQPIIQYLAEVSPHLAERVSIPFFVSFWTRSLQDILVHTPSYDNEIHKLRSQLKEVNADRSDVSASGLKERERKKKALSETQDKLRDELKGRIASYQKTRNRISRQEKDHWFSRSMKKNETDARHIGLLQECFLPRAMLSSLDAHYCFLMLKILHDNGTPGFRTVHLLSHLFQRNELATLMFQCTAMEAQHFGRFLCETLRLLQHWHADKATYEREALGEKQKLPGFAKTLDPNGDPQVVQGYEDFRRLLFNWHSHLNGALHTCFDSKEYMYIRNGIIVLRAIVQVFPALNFMGEKIVKQVTKLSEEETRQDLKLAAKSLLGPLRTGEKHWMMPQAFRINDKESGRSGSRAPSARPETPQPNAGTPKLNATAPEFKPTSNLANGTARKESIAGTEDGEIEDEKQVIAKDSDKEITDVADPKKVPEQLQETTIEKLDNKETRESTPKPSASETAKETPRPASKPPTPAPIPSKPPPPEYRPDTSRPSSTQPNSSRTSHALPSRPPNKPLPAPPGPERTSSRYGSRDDDQYGRLSRPNELRPASRDQSPGRSRARTPERDPYYGHPGSGRGPPRDERGPPRLGGDARQARDDSWVSSRREQPPQSLHSRPLYEPRDRSNGSMGPPPAQSAQPQTSDYTTAATSNATAQQSSRQGPSSAQPSQSAQGENQYHENPARLAMINDDQRGGRDRARDASAPQKDSRRDRDVRDERATPSTSQHEGRSVPQEPSRDSQARADQPSDLAPRGPRRHGGRLSQDLGPGGAQESSYGRLNGPQDVPSGIRPPNGPSGRVSRTYPAPTSQSNARSNEPPPPSPSASRPPESPAAFRAPASRLPMDRRSSGPQFDRQPSSNSVPTTPATENGPQVHPSRLGQVDVQPPPIQTNLPAQGPRNAGSPTTAPPSGPRGAVRPPAGTPTGPSPSSSGPPSGPASAIERQRRPDRRQLGSINATLQTANNATGPNSQGVSFRGAAQSRPPSGPVTSGANAQPVQAIASPLDPPMRRNEPPAPERQEMQSSRPESQADLFQAKQAPNNEDGRGSSRSRRREDERTDRQRSSRTASGERRAADGPSQRPPATGVEDNADRRSGARDDRRPRTEREPRDAMAPRESRGPEREQRNDDLPPRRPPPQAAPNSFLGPPPGWERPDARREQPHRGAPEREGRGTGRPEEFRGTRGQEERRDAGRAPRDIGAPPAPPPGSRKRRHEDAPGPFDESKRRRSGR